MRLTGLLLAAILALSACAKKSSAPQDPLGDDAPQTTDELGSLDRAVIEDVIKRNMNQLRYCYQRALVQDPALQGKVVVKFVIAKDGSVASAVVKQDELGEERVTSCLVGRFLRMEFPPPEGNGMVIVSYPLVFSSTAEE